MTRRLLASTARRLAAASVTLAFLVTGGLAAGTGSLNPTDWLDKPLPGYCSWTENGHTVLSLHDPALARFGEARTAGDKIPAMTVTCTYLPLITGNDTAVNDRGLTSTAQHMFDTVTDQFGFIPYGGFQPGGVTTGHIRHSAHYEGRAVDFFFRPYTNRHNRVAGWQLAQWAVLHADELDIQTVIFDDHIWTRTESFLGWRRYTHPDGPTDNPILRHLDHVHIDVR